MKILVTGAAGFIGYNLCKKLLLQGHVVIGIDNFSASYDISINKLRFKKLQEFKSFEFIYFDVTKGDFEVILKRKDIDYLIHAAAKDLYYDEKNPTSYSSFLTSNVLAASRMFELAKLIGAKKFIHLSTYIIYGSTKKEILTENKLLPKPVSPYAASRLAEEQAIEFMSKFYDFPTIILRIFSTYGPGMRPKTIIPHFLYKLLNDQTIVIKSSENQSRDFVYVDDVVDCIRKSLTKRLKFQIINVASGETTTNTDLAKKLAGLTEKGKCVDVIHSEELSPSKYPVKQTKASTYRARKILGYNSPTSLEDGLKRTVAWYKENPEFLKSSSILLD